MQKTYREGFTLKSDGAGLRIQVDDYHAEPLYLDQAALAEIGLQLRQDHHLKYDPAQAKKGERLIIYKRFISSYSPRPFKACLFVI